MTNDPDEYEKRLVPASDQEIIGLAECMWADPSLRTIFERVGYDGDMTSEEQAAVNAAIDDYRQGRLWDRDRLHLALAPCLLRQLAAEMIDALDSAEATSFLRDRKVERVGSGMKGITPTPEEVMAFAKALKRNSATWQVIMHLKDYPDMFVSEGDPDGVLGRFETDYRYKYGLLNRSRSGGAIGLLRAVAAGNIESLDCTAAWTLIKDSLLMKR